MDQETLQAMREAMDRGDMDEAARLQREWAEREGRWESEEQRENRLQAEWLEKMSQPGALRSSLR